MKLLGIDDAGRGPVLGPMVLAGILIESEEEEEIKTIGAKDSKLLEMEIIDVGIPRKNLVIKDLDFDPNDIENLPESGLSRAKPVKNPILIPAQKFPSEH